MVEARTRGVAQAAPLATVRRETLLILLGSTLSMRGWGAYWCDDRDNLSDKGAIPGSINPQ